MDNRFIGFYGCARRHRIKSGAFVHIITNDIEPKHYCNITFDVREILQNRIFLNQFDFYIFTPPCNYYSHANWRRETSLLALETKDILPLCLEFCVSQNKPFIVENVLNKTFFKDLYPQYQFTFGGHTFWSNVIKDQDVKDLIPIRQNKQYISRSKRDGNYNVDIVFKRFLLFSILRITLNRLRQIVNQVK